VDLPSFLNRSDFIGKYLPGYVLVVLYILLFEFDKISSLDKDIITALVFVVAGPTLGYTITQFHRSLPYIRSAIIGDKDDSAKEELKKTVRRYARLKTLLSVEEKSELELAEAEYDFSISTGIVFLLLEAIIFYHIVINDLKLDPLIQIPFLVLAGCLFVNAHYQKTRAYYPLFSEFVKKYKIT